VNLLATTLKDHPIWHNLAQTLQQLDPNQIAAQHLQACNAQINGYWSEADEFYEVIAFTHFPQPAIISSSLGISQSVAEGSYWLKLRFALEVDQSCSNGETSMGELSLILDENLEVIDENWLINLDSPYVLATH
jgi:hypothetical protein